ncbi:MAG: hypothetical protein GEV10_25675 [Streptosporangiales bacterium]|nr:hypothetical protein [Streptosporangiales bacterium]
MTPEQYRDFKTSLRDALLADGIDPADVDVRLQGSAAHFFSGPHKQFPGPGHPDWNPTTEQAVRDWFGDDPARPKSRPFDSGKKLGVDPKLSDYDVQISSDKMLEVVQRRWEEKDFKGELLKEPFGFANRDAVSQSFRKLNRWAHRWRGKTGRDIAPALFGSSGPPHKGSDISAHFRPDDWIVDLVERSSR